MRARDGFGHVTGGRIPPAQVEAFREDDQPTALGRRLPDGAHGTMDVGLRTARFDKDLAHPRQDSAHARPSTPPGPAPEIPAGGGARLVTATAWDSCRPWSGSFLPEA